jgi:hypothetical protein
VDAGSATGEMLRRCAFNQTTLNTREYLYLLAPYWQTCGDLLSTDSITDMQALSLLIAEVLPPDVSLAGFE